MGVLPDWMIKESGAVTPNVEGVKREGKISYGLSSYGYDIRAGYKFKIFTNVYGSVIDPKKFDSKMLVEVDLQKHDWRSVPPNSLRCSRCGCGKWASDLAHYEPCLADEPSVLIPPNSFALAETVETISVPRDTLALVIGKSTYARCGLILNCTPLEPEWRGKITLELSNTAPLPMRVYANEGIAQVLFFKTAGVEHALEMAVNTMLLPKQMERLGVLRVLEEFQLFHRSCNVSYEDKRGKYQDQVGLETPKVD